MKRNFLLAIFAMVFLAWGCSDTKDAAKDDTEETGKKKKPADDEESSNDESSSQNDPADVVRTIIKAAKTENYSSLSGICAADADGDSKDICNLENLVDRQEEFKEYFAKAKVVGDAEVNGNEAAVKIMFGPDGDKEETMNLVKEGKKWKLLSF